LRLGKAEFKEQLENSVNSSASRVQLTAVKTFRWLVEALEKSHKRRCAAKQGCFAFSERQEAASNHSSNATFQAKA